MTRRLVAALACRANGSRLFGKPLQNLLDETTILDQIIEAIKRFEIVDEIVLGISEGVVNHPFMDVAHAHGVSYILGDPQDVLMRLIQCARMGRATDVFRVTTECPWFAQEMLPSLWREHLESGNDITVCDRLPEGLAFEIYTHDALQLAHDRGTSRDRSEFCSNYPRTHPSEFKVGVFVPPPKWQRLDLRVTVDYPEDLIVARAIATHFRDALPLLSTGAIIEFLDSRPDIKDLVAQFVHPEPTWGMIDPQIWTGDDPA
ncbi:MAG: Acylneuraminate cytidylyltransferase [Betaproteobacteria bacterium]|nr:Acylneuraminate cytidylyltransferase [Betaproteobacteria bacterium]